MKSKKRQKPLPYQRFNAQFLKTPDQRYVDDLVKNKHKYLNEKRKN